MDVLADVMRTLHFEGYVACQSTFGAPWGLGIPATDGASFHIVDRGGCLLELEGERRTVALAAGDMVVVTRRRGHRLVSAPGARVRMLPDVLHERGPDRSKPLKLGGDGPGTTLTCGSFRMKDGGGRHPLFSLLPPVMHVRGESGRTVPWLEATMRFITQEAGIRRIGGEAIVSKLIDVLFVQALRAWLETAPERAGGWLGALRDPQIGTALALMHERPAESWSVATLASAAGMSRSAFAARFTALVGQAPLEYLTRWRMQLATAMLRDSQSSLAQVAERVGYASEVAFHRAFRREMGRTPGSLRERPTELRRSA